MILLEGNMNGLLYMVIGIYLLCHSPAIITLIIGIFKWKSKPEIAKKLFIFSGIYFIVGAGVCGSMF